MLATLLLLALCCGQGVLRAQDAESDNPTGPSGDFNGEVTTGGGYDPLTANVKRRVTDLSVPGSNGAYPLALARTYCSNLAAVGGDKPYFGDGGNWRHGYQWAISIGSYNNYNGNVTAYTVAYPDGAVITFRPGRASAPSSERATFWRGPSGTADRLEVQDSSHIYLHTGDGGLVNFGGTIHPASLVDPYGAVTQLTYLSTNPNYLAQVTEPGGRWLRFSYVTATYKTKDLNNAPVTKTYTLLSQVQASTGQTVTYTATPGSGQTYGSTGAIVPYYLLTDVSYDYEPLAAGGGNVHAQYTYNDITLQTAVDPHYAGAMKQIRYAGYGFSFEEQNFGSSTRVSRMDISQGSGGTLTTSTETRGDTSSGTGNTSGVGANLTRTLKYGSNNPTIPGDTNPPPNVKPSLLTSSSDFEAYTTYNYYYDGSAKDTYGKSFLQSTVDARGNVVTYRHEPLTGRVTWTKLPDNRVRTAVWRAANDVDTSMPYYLYQSTDERGQSVTYHHQGNGSVTRVDYPDSYETYQYQPFSGNGGTFYKVSLYTNKLGGQIVYAYDEANHGGSGFAGLLTSVTRKYKDVGGTLHSETTSFHYDPIDRVDQTSDPRGVSDVFGYNARHQVTTVIHVSDGLNPHSHVDTTYDDWGRPVNVTDELGHTATTKYDEYSRPKEVTTPVNAGGISTRTVRTTYERRDNSNNVVGSALSHTSGAFSYQLLPSGRAVQHIYTPNGRLSDQYEGQSTGNLNNLSFTQCLRTEANLTYDPVGNLLQSTDAQGKVWKGSYDNCNRPSTATDPLGHVTTTTYYPSNHQYAGLVKQVDAPGNNAATTLTTQYTSYDLVGRCMSWVSPQNNLFGSGYDAAGNLASQSDGMPTSQHPATQYAYDQLGRKGRITHADGTYQEWKYDASGNVASYRNRKGNTQTFSAYNGRNQPTGYSWDDGVTPTAGMSFDTAGRCTGLSNGYSNLIMTYDDSGALLTEQQSIGGGTGGPTVSYTPDADGRVDTITYPGGDVASWHRDYLGRIDQVPLQIASQGGNKPTLATYSYYAGWLANRMTCAGVGTAYNHQDNGRIDVAVQYVNGGATISHRTYGYYPDGQMSWFNKTADGSTNTLENNRGDAYTYQADGSLAGVKHESLGVYNGSPNAQGDSTPNGGTDVQRTNNYQYDAAGNRTYADESGTVQDTTYTNENLHYSYSYDDNRNVTTGVANNGIWQYRYDGFNQLLEARPYPYTSVTASFVYDPKGRLCQRTVAGVTTRLYYAGDQVVEERDANNQRTCAYFYGAGGERVGRLYASGAAVFFHYDARGFVTHLTDLGHNVLEQYLYDAFGQPLVYYAATGGQTAATYQGQASRFAENRCLWAQDYEWYPELGLYRCGARFFNPHAAHWLQPDPIGQAGGLNLYAYCGNDPINQVDPSGLEPGSIDWYGNGIKQMVGYGPGGSSPDGWSYKNQITSSETSDGQTFSVDWSKPSDPGGAWGRGFSSLSSSSLWESRSSNGGAYNWRENYRSKGELSDVDKVFRNFADGQKDDPMVYVDVTRGVADATTAFVAPEAEVVEEGWMLTKGGQTLTNAVGEAAPTIENLVKAAQKAYPKKAGITELHHITPKYLGGAADGPLVPLDGAYHQQITNAFRSIWGYGRAKPSAEELQQIMQEVYSQYPLPGG